MVALEDATMPLRTMKVAVSNLDPEMTIFTVTFLVVLSHSKRIVFFF